MPSSVAAIKHLHAGNAGAAGVGNRAGKMHPASTGDEVGVRGPAIAGQRHRRERLARRRGVERDNCGRCRPSVLLAASMLRTDSVPAPAASVTPLADQVPAPAVASIQVVAIDAHLDLLARRQRAGEACRSPSAPPRW